MSRTRKIKLAVLGLILAACAIQPAVTRAGSAGATVSIAATVDTFAEWSTATPSIVAGDWSGLINAVNQTRTVTKALTLFTNVTTTITPTAGANSGILTLGGTTIPTSYQITGDVDSPDAGYMDAGAGAGEFFEGTNTYALTHVPGDGSYTVNLLVRAISPASAPDAGSYTCGVILTASW